MTRGVVYGCVSPAVLYRDADVIVVDKPARLLVHRSELAPDRDVMMTRVRDAIGAHVWPVHRLDRATSGALAFALSEAAARRLCAAFDAGEVEKRYLAIARGEVPEEVLVDYAIPKGEGKPRVEAVTRFRRLFAGGWFSVVEARPFTGRFHQIRRHLSHLRHPIANDSNYGTGWFNRKMRSDAGLMRLALHATELTLPGLTGPIRVHAPLAPDLEDALLRLAVPADALHLSD